MRITDAYVRVWKIDFKETSKGTQIADMFVSTSNKKQDDTYEYYNWGAVAFNAQVAKLKAMGIEKGSVLLIKNGIMKQEKYNGQYTPKLYILEFDKYVKQNEDNHANDRNNS